MMLYSVANLHEIGFIARVHARISRWILIFVALYVFLYVRVVFLYVRAISARTEIFNRGTRKCQSRRDVTYDCNVSRAGPASKPGRRDAMEMAKSGKN